MLKNLTVAAYTELLASDAPAPGGGSAAAMLGAQGLALVAMAAGLTLGRKKYADAQDFCRDAQARAQALMQALLTQADADTDAYLAVAAAYKLPREDEGAALIRAMAIHKATLGATETPLSTLALCQSGLELATELIGRFNMNAASDLATGAESLYAGARGAYYNVKINLSGLHDTEAADYQTRADERLKACERALLQLRALL